MSIANTNGTKSLGRKELVAMAVGNIIGGGVMTMTGIAIGITGRSVLFAYIISAVLVLIMSLPHFFTAATIRMNGGFYTQAALFGGKWFAGLYSVVFISNFFGAATYSISFADYVLSAFPEINARLVAFRNFDCIYCAKSYRNKGCRKGTVYLGRRFNYRSFNIYRIWRNPHRPQLLQ